jgi:hypothetical protein
MGGSVSDVGFVLEVVWEALERLAELSYCEIEALELLAADCETEAVEILAADWRLELTTEAEAAEEVVIKLALFDLVLETGDPDEELAVWAGAT